MEQFPSLITNVKDLKRKKELENLISVYDEGKFTIAIFVKRKKSANKSRWTSHQPVFKRENLVRVARAERQVYAHLHANAIVQTLV